MQIAIREETLAFLEWGIEQNLERNFLYLKKSISYFW